MDGRRLALYAGCVCVQMVVMSYSMYVVCGLYMQMVVMSYSMILLLPTEEGRLFSYVCTYMLVPIILCDAAVRPE